MSITNSGLCAAVVGVCLMVLPAIAQIQQTSPELCGQPGETVAVPHGVTGGYILDHAELTLTRNDTTTTIPLDGMTEIKQVCPLRGDKLAVFAYDSGSGASKIFLIGNETVLDTITTAEGIIAPDQRSLVYRLFHPIHAEMLPSEEYLLYDLTRAPGANTHYSVDPNDANYGEQGIVIYPVVPKQAPFNSWDLPKELRHSGGRLLWAKDSRSLVFLDQVNGNSSIVWVRIQDSEHTTAWLHPIGTAGLAPAPSGWPEGAKVRCLLSDMEVRTGNFGEPEVALQFRGKGEGWQDVPCPVDPVVLPAAEFKPAPVERIPSAPKRKTPVRKGMGVDGRRMPRVAAQVRPAYSSGAIMEGPK